MRVVYFGVVFDFFNCGFVEFISVCVLFVNVVGVFDIDGVMFG